METGEFGKQACMRRAAELVAAGEAIGTYLDGVDTIWIDAASPKAVRKIEIIKGEKRTGMPLSTALEAVDLVPLLDEGRIPTNLRSIFLDPHELAGRLGALAVLRLPIPAQTAAQLPHVLSTHTADGTYWLQNWIPNGHEAGTGLVRELKKVGVNLPGGTSMNISGRPEIADQDEAFEFSRERGIAYLLRDPHPSHKVEGSFPILTVRPNVVAVLREGHYPSQIFQDLLDGEPVDFSQAKPAKYPISPTILQRFSNHGLSAHALRSELLRVIHDIS